MSNLYIFSILIFSLDNKNNDGEGEKARSHISLEMDSGLLRALDRLIIYLRIVYSIDFYAATLYSLEDMMPHQCGIFHVRDSIEGRNQTVFQYEVNDYITVSSTIIVGKSVRTGRYGVVSFLLNRRKANGWFRTWKVKFSFLF